MRFANVRLGSRTNLFFPVHPEMDKESVLDLIEEWLIDRQSGMPIISIELSPVPKGMPINISS